MEELNRFFDNDNFKKIGEDINRFNPIKVMGMERMEIRHSFVLRWLLDPRENHGLKEQFLKDFIEKAFDNDKGADSDLSLNEIEYDLENAVVHREWQCEDGAGRIDLLVLSPQNNWAIVIENKFDSTQYDGQLSGYIEAVKKKFKNGCKVQGIFLTLRAEKPEGKYADLYAPIGYEDVYKILSLLVKQKLEHEVGIFLEHYLNVIGEAIDIKKIRELRRRACGLYRENKEVLDFIINSEQEASITLGKQAHDRCRKNKKVLDFIVNSRQGAFITAAKNIFGKEMISKSIDNHRFIYGHLKGDYLGLVPTGWYEILGRDKYKWPGSEKVFAGWILPVTLWIHYFSHEEIRLYANINLDTERENLIGAFRTIEKDNPRIKLRLDEEKEGANTVNFLPTGSETIVNIFDEEAIEDAMKNILASFDSEFCAVEVALNNFMQQVGKRLDKRNNDE